MHNFHPDFVQLLPRLYRKVEVRVLDPNASSRPVTRASTPAKVESGIDRGDSQADVSVPSHETGAWMPAQPPDIDPANTPWDAEDLWSSLFGPGMMFTPNAIHNIFEDQPSTSDNYFLGGMYDQPVINAGLQ